MKRASALEPGNHGLKFWPGSNSKGVFDKIFTWDEFQFPYLWNGNNNI